MNTIHPSAVVHPGARLGQDVSVGPFTYIEEDVVIGDGCRIGPHVSLLRYTTLGPACAVHAGAVLGDLPQDLGYKSGESFVRIGARCVLREGVTVHRGTKPGTITEIGDDCFLMAFSHFGHNVKLGTRVIVANGALLAGYVETGDGVFISGNVVIHQFSRIGRLAMLGGSAQISQDVPPFTVTAPGKHNILAGLNVVGLRRAGIGGTDRLAIKRAYRTLFRSGLGMREAVRQVRAESHPSMVEELCAFIDSAKRGVCSVAVGANADSSEADPEV